MEKLTKSQVIARVKRQGSLTIELYPSNCGPSNQTWVRGYEVELFFEDGVVIQRTADDMSTFEALINSFTYYNCGTQLGKRVHYYAK